MFLPLVVVVPRLAGLGIHGVWLASALSDGCVAVIAVVLMLGEFSRMRALERDGACSSDALEGEGAR